MSKAASIIFQAAKLGDRGPILAEFDRAERLLRSGVAVGRIYGLSGGALVALGCALALAARRDPARWGEAQAALADLAWTLRRAHGWQIRRLILDPRYGFYTLQPLRRRVASLLRRYAGRDDLWLSELGVPLYLCALDADGVLTLLGPPDETLQCTYQFVHLGPPRDAPILDALTAALGTMLSTAPTLVPAADGAPATWLRDARPAIADAGAIVADLETADPRPLRRSAPHVPIRPWKLNWFTSSFIMHSQGERNQALLAAYYLDLLQRQRALQAAYRQLARRLGREAPAPAAPLLGHVYLPYIGSTEALTNMRESAANKEALLARFRELLQGQVEAIPCDQPTNVIYGAGGFSGILAGLVTTRAVDAGFARGGGEIRQVYGVSAGVLNGFFHAVQLAAARQPGLYTPAAAHALDDLEGFMARIEPGHLVRTNRNPLALWRGFANLEPLERYLLERLAAYTGSPHPAELTFDDIALPLTVTAARRDGFTDFLGMTGTGRRMRFAGREWPVRPAPVVRAIIAGWSMNTYILPTPLGDQVYQDGGGTFYDPALFVACLDPELTNLLNIHLDEPEGHSYRLPPRPDIVRIVFDTHNYAFPEERRRMRLLSDLLYEHYRLRARYAGLLSGLSPAEGVPAADAPQVVAGAYVLPPDFRREWTLELPKELQ
jgi:predicted acylesterase/phospholipase RssA